MAYDDEEFQNYDDLLDDEEFEDDLDGDFSNTHRQNYAYDDDDYSFDDENDEDSYEMD